MKILHVEAGRHLYGGPRQVLHLLKGLDARGVMCELACPQDSAIGRAATCQRHLLPMRGDADVALVFALHRLIRERRPDLVHLHSRRGADVLGGLAARWAGVPVVLSRRVDNPEPRWSVGAKYRLFRRVICISRAINAVLQDAGVPPAKLRTVPSAVDTDRFRPGGDREALERRFGLCAGLKLIGMAAQFIERKGHRSLIEALPRLLEQDPEVHLLLFGQGPLLPRVRAQVQTAGLSPHVTFAGFAEDLHTLLPCLDVLAHPASHEGLGIAVLQAAASGLPVVAGRAGGLPEAVIDAVTGRLVVPGDVAALAEALQAVLQDPGRAREMGQAGRQHVETHFSIPAMVEGNLAVYRELLTSK